MSINKSSCEINYTHTEAYYEELASQEENYLEETEEELRAILTSDDLSPSPNGGSVLAENRWDRELVQTDIRTIKTSDGPENAMFCASSTSPSRGNCGGAAFRRGSPTWCSRALIWLSPHRRIEKRPAMQRS